MHPFQAVVERLVKTGSDLTLRQIAVLLACRDGENSTVRALHARLGIAKPAVTRSLDALESAGYVKRRADPSDRRSVLVATTKQGDKFVQGMLAG